MINSNSNRQNGEGGNINGSNMMVAVRVRPLSKEEKEGGISECVSVLKRKESQSNVGNQCNQEVVAITKAGTNNYLKSQQTAITNYAFDAAFGPESNQLDVYEKTTKRYIPSLIDGYNLTVFAYGATGAGKTHTMMGDYRVDKRIDGMNNSETQSGCKPEREPRPKAEMGIIPHCLVDIFEQIEIQKGKQKERDTDNTPLNENMEWSIRVGYLEVYNEQIYDLIEPSSKTLSVREDSTKGIVVVAGLKEVEVTSADQVLELLLKGNTYRKTESTHANEVSSRSHAVLQVTVRCISTDEKGHKKSRESKLSCIDLAGSERASATHNRGARLQEGAHINKSLLALANCINSLSDYQYQFSTSFVTSNHATNSNGTFRNVKYRDSKLTHLLKTSLEGECKVVMIANINPSHQVYEDSHNTLKYANRAKNIKVNQGSIIYEDLPPPPPSTKVKNSTASSGMPWKSNDENDMDVITNKPLGSWLEEEEIENTVISNKSMQNKQKQSNVNTASRERKSLALNSNRRMTRSSILLAKSKAQARENMSQKITKDESTSCHTYISSNNSRKRRSMNMTFDEKNISSKKQRKVETTTRSQQEVIEELQKKLAEKDDIIASMEKEIAELRKKLDTTTGSQEGFQQENQMQKQLDQDEKEVDSDKESWTENVNEFVNVNKESEENKKNANIEERALPLDEEIESNKQRRQVRKDELQNRTKPSGFTILDDNDELTWTSTKINEVSNKNFSIPKPLGEGCRPIDRARRRSLIPSCPTNKAMKDTALIDDSQDLQKKVNSRVDKKDDNFTKDNDSTLKSLTKFGSTLSKFANNFMNSSDPTDKENFKTSENIEKHIDQVKSNDLMRNIRGRLAGRNLTNTLQNK